MGKGLTEMRLSQLSSEMDHLNSIYGLSFVMHEDWIWGASLPDQCTSLLDVANGLSEGAIPKSCSMCMLPVFAVKIAVQP